MNEYRIRVPLPDDSRSFLETLRGVGGIEHIDHDFVELDLEAEGEWELAKLVAELFEELSSMCHAGHRTFDLEKLERPLLIRDDVKPSRPAKKPAVRKKAKPRARR